MSIRRHPLAGGAPAPCLRALPVDTSLATRLREVFERLRAPGMHLGEIFYARLFQAAPHLKPLFRSTPAEQAEKLLQALEAVVRNFENSEANAALLEELGRRHVSYGVRAEHYDLVIDLMIESIEHLLGPHADRRLLDEWRMALRLISDQMIAAAGSGDRLGSFNGPIEVGRLGDANGTARRARP